MSFDLDESAMVSIRWGWRRALMESIPQLVMYLILIRISTKDGLFITAHTHQTRKNIHPSTWRAHLLESCTGAIGRRYTTEDRAPTRYLPTIIQGLLTARCWNSGIHSYSSWRNRLHEAGLSIEDPVKAAPLGWPLLSRKGSNAVFEFSANS